MTEQMTTSFKAVRFSGLRYNSPPHQRQAEYTHRVQALVSATPGILEAFRAEPAFLDDTLACLEDSALWRNILSSGEVFVMADESYRILAVQALSDVHWNRYATWSMWVTPTLRGQPVVDEMAQFALDYAFKEAPEGLGVFKLKVLIHPENLNAIGLAQKCGFTPVATLPLEGSFHGQPSSMLLLEKYKPDVFTAGEELDVSQHSRRSGDEPELLRHDELGDTSLHPDNSSDNGPKTTGKKRGRPRGSANRKPTDATSARRKQYAAAGIEPDE